MSARPIGVGIIGFGFMGPTHARAYTAAAGAGHPCRVVSVCDRTIPSLEAGGTTGNIDTGAAPLDLSDVKLVRDPADLLADTGIGLVSICTHTDTHVEIALRALEAGKHVLVEKPVALTAAAVEPLADAAERAHTLCMPAMCMRFWPAWRWIADAVADGRFGAVRSATFQRLVSRPDWAPAFYGDDTRTGGPLADLHIHDTDFLYHCFGMPRAVRTQGDHLHLSTHFTFDDGPLHAWAEAAWDMPPGAGFTMRCTIVFEHASADFAIGREPELRVAQGDEAWTPDLEPISGYDGQARALLHAIHEGHSEPPATMREALDVARIIDAERESLRTGGTVHTDRA